MPIGWPQFVIGVIGGLALGFRRGALIPIPGPCIWWVHHRVSGDFFDVANQTSDSLAEIAFVAAMIGFFLGGVGVVLGATIRTGVDRLRKHSGA